MIKKMGYIIIILVPFFGCKKDYSSIELSSIDETVLVSDLQKGNTLYYVNCVGCHGQINESTKTSASYDSLKTAIEKQPEMKYLNYLTDSQLRIIVNALNNVTKVTLTSVSDYKPVVANRYQLTSILKDLFVAETNMTAQDTAIDNLIFKYIMQKPEAFEGNCHRNDLDCLVRDTKVAYNCGPSGSDCGALRALSEANTVPNISPLRKGYLVKACEEILANDKAVTNVLSKFGLSVSSPITVNNVNTIVKYITLDKINDTKLSTEITNVASAARALSYGTLDQWRFSILPLCYSPLMGSF